MAIFGPANGLMAQAAATRRRVIDAIPRIFGAIREQALAAGGRAPDTIARTGAHRLAARVLRDDCRKAAPGAVSRTVTGRFTRVWCR